MRPAEALAITMFVLSVSSVFTLRGPLGRALAERIAGRRLDGKKLDGDAETRELADRWLEELEDVKERMAGLEERQDFAERVLSYNRARLGAGG